MTTKPSKPVTAARVRAVLRKAGFDMSKSTSSAIRGLRHHSMGYLIRTTMREIRVAFIGGAFRDGPVEDDWRERFLKQYRNALTAAGITCEIVGDEVVVLVDSLSGEGA